MLILTAVTLALTQLGGGCSKDTDCKGDRICENGRCTSPAPVSVPAPPPPPLVSAPPAVGAPEAATSPPSSLQSLPPPVPRRKPEEYPRVVRRPGEVCLESLNDEGAVQLECRPDEAAPRRVRPAAAPDERAEPAPRGARSRAAPGERAEPPPRVRRTDEVARSSFVADFGGTGLLAVLAGGGAVVAMPGFGLHLALGGRVTDSVGVVGVLDGALAFVPGASVLAVTFAPGLRLGDASHATIALGPTVVAFTSVVGNLAGLAGTLLVRGVFPLSSGFGLHTQLGLTFDVSGGFLTLAIGIGGSSF